MSNKSFDGVDRQTGGVKIDTTPVKLTEELLDECFKHMEKDFGRLYCQDSSGIFHHWPNPFYLKTCQLCGWTL